MDVAGDVIERWLPVLVLGAGVVAGWMLRRQPVVRVASTGAGIVTRALQVASAIAAVERFRRRAA